MAGRVELKKVVEKMDLKNLTPNVDIGDKTLEIPDINRPALQLTGYLHPVIVLSHSVYCIFKEFKARTDAA